MIEVVGYFLAVIVIICMLFIVSTLRDNAKIKRRIERQWGKKSDKKYSKGEINDISKYFRNISEHEKKKFFIDDTTWSDPDMDEIFKNLDTTYSTPGAEYLYAMLREPIYNDGELKYRNEIIEYFMRNPEKRKVVQYILGKLGIRRGVSVTDYFYNVNHCEHKYSLLNVYRILRILPVISIASMVVDLYAGVFLLITSCFINIAVHYFFKNKLDYRLRDFAYIINIVRCANSILKIQLEDLGQCICRLKNAAASVRKVKKFYFNLFNNGTDMSMLIEYKNILFLTDLINYEKMGSMLEHKDEEFKSIYSIVGKIDSCIAIASYRVMIKNYTVPKLHMYSDKKNRNIIIRDLVHPLIEGAVPNSLEIMGSILITGSNASGKSTFLKALALNIIFAQTIYTCTASYFEGYYVKIYTSMALRDNVLAGESYYIAEIRSLKRIMDNAGGNMPAVCFIDEILRGTNTVERIAASSQILKYLTLDNCICIAATHDIELTYILENYFKNYHFQENIADDEISFNYKIYRGRSTTQNAIKLLRILGYGDNIVNEAEGKAALFLKNGLWGIEK